MSEYITRRRCRTIRTLLRACTAALIGVMLICTGIIASLAVSVHTELVGVSKAQEDALNTLMWHRVSTEAEFLEPVIEPEPKVVSLGTFRITHYCPCSVCCGKTDGITKTGTKATSGRTIGVDPKVIPLGSTVYIDGQIYTAEDTGAGIKGNEIDIFVKSHKEALEKGVYVAEVFMEVGYGNETGKIRIIT